MLLAGACVAALSIAALPAMAGERTSKPFSGAKVNGGTATLATSGTGRTLTLSDDFKVPDTPDPHWQVVDGKGQVFLLQRLGVKSLGGLVKDRVNMSITLPDYVKDVATVQIYCSWAEAVLGEARFAGTQMTQNSR
jgi:hypothetical protein